MYEAGPIKDHFKQLKGRRSLRSPQEHSTIDDIMARSSRSRQQSRVSPDKLNGSESCTSNDESDFCSPSRQKQSPRKQSSQGDQEKDGKEILEPVQLKSISKLKTDEGTKSKLSGSSKTVLLTLVSVVILPISFLLYANFVSGNSQLHGEISGFNLSKEFNDLAQRFPNQEPSIWEWLRLGVQSVNSSGAPAVFLLVHSGDSSEAYDIARSSGDIAWRYLGGETEYSPVEVSGSEMSTLKDHGTLVSQYMPEVERRSVFIVRALDDACGTVAQGLRYFCDEYSIQGPRAAVFLLLDIAGCPGSHHDLRQVSQLEMVQSMEECLTSLWEADIGPEILAPLLVRLINVVLPVHSTSAPASY